MVNEPPTSPTHADDVTRRYHIARARTNRRINFWLMLAALAGTIVSSATFVFLWQQKVIFVWLAGFSVVCLVAFAVSAQGWIKGNRVIDQFDDVSLT